MSYFLLTFTRGNGTEPEIERYDDRDIAMDRFTATERQLRKEGGGRGVVLLIADSEETLRKTHSHYFYTLEELLAQLPA